MIPSSFDYLRPRTIQDLKAALAGHGDRARLLAGGQSLLTDLKLRRKNPALVLDLSGVPGLDEIAVGLDALTFGAMARQADIAGHPDVAARLPLLLEVANVAADPLVRRRGTLVGACCEVAPGGDWLAAALALDGVLLVDGVRGRRTVALGDFVRGPAENALAPGEFARSLRLPLPGAGAVAGYRKVKHVAVGWSVAGAAIVLTPGGDGRVERASVAVSGALAYPRRLPVLEAALPGLDFADQRRLGEAIQDSLAGLDYQGDYYASPGYRRKRLALLIRRTLAELAV
ncbi:FAD binding domain-containing protein [Amycolatopsis nigrescens]|uniref:FAD binding domain-containing protein n=1 Tax=Amycolatopsis nigrescens TaxID=381445 RepID=UPI000361A152|nr:FAD binding domain-containing protein [Amycolatopsis nigrescens]